jgi:hypothetical protein
LYNSDAAVPKIRPGRAGTLLDFWE